MQWSWVQNSWPSASWKKQSETSFLWRWNRYIFHIPCLVNIVENIIYYKTSITQLWKGSREASHRMSGRLWYSKCGPRTSKQHLHLLGTSQSKERMSQWLTEFLFFLNYFWLEKPATVGKHQEVQGETKGLMESLFSPDKNRKRKSNKKTFRQ